MRADLWVALFRRIPAAKQNQLIVVTRTGTELMVQRILRLDEDVVIMRARLAGSTEHGRIVLLPYDQINNLAFNGVLPESEIAAMFGTLEPEEGSAAPAPAAAEAARTEETGEPATAETEAENEPSAPAAPAPPPPPAEAPKPSKSVLLARLRARLAERA